MQADTEAWLGRVNLIYAFGTEYLGRAPAAAIMSAELYQFFASTIKASGHSRWSEATFQPRLREFAAARGWVIEKKKTKHSKDRLSQPPVDFPVDPPKILPGVARPSVQGRACLARGGRQPGEQSRGEGRSVTFRI